MKPKIYHFIPNLIEGGGVNYPLILSESIKNYEHIFIYKNCSSVSLLESIKNGGYKILKINNIYDFLRFIYPYRKNSIYHFHGYGNYKLFFLCRLVTRANIIQPHGYFPSTARKGLYGLLARILEISINHLSFRIVSISSGEKSKIGYFYKNYTKNKVITILTGMDVNKIQYKKKRIEDKRKITFISLSARNIYQKGLDRLLIFSKKLNQFKIEHEINVYFRGNNDKELLMFIKMIEEFKGHSVYRKEIVSDVWDKLEYMPDFLISLSRFEGLPLTVIEAGLRGVPIILTKSIPGHKEFGGIDGVYEVDERFLDKYHNDILFNDLIEFLKKIKTSDKKEFEKRFNFEKMIHNYKEIYGKCLDWNNYSS